MNANIDLDRPDLPFHKAFQFGPSTKNQRIESFWNLLANGLTDTYRNIFAAYQRKGFFIKGNLYDRVALKFIYMIMLRTHVHKFVEMHNSHPIRRQRKRAHYLPSGIPDDMYTYPQSGVDYGQEPDWEQHTFLQANVFNYDLDEYLPARTMATCSMYLRRAGFPTEFKDLSSRHEDAYYYLRNALRNHEGQEDDIMQLEKPLDPERWLRENAPSQDVMDFIRSELNNLSRKEVQLEQTDEESDFEGHSGTYHVVNMF